MDATVLLFKPSQRGSAAQEVVNNVRTQRLRFGDFLGGSEKDGKRAIRFQSFRFPGRFFFFVESFLFEGKHPLRSLF